MLKKVLVSIAALSLLGFAGCKAATETTPADTETPEAVTEPAATEETTVEATGESSGIEVKVEAEAAGDAAVAE